MAVAKLPAALGDELKSHLAGGLEVARRAAEGSVAEAEVGQSRDVNAWWSRDDSRQPGALRVQMHSSVEMVELLMSSIVGALGEVGEQHEGDMVRFEMLHTTDDGIDHLGVELASDELILPFLRGIAKAVFERRDPVAVRGDEQLVEMLLRVPPFARPAADGGIPAAPPPPAPRPVDEDPKMEFTDLELHELLSSRMFVGRAVELADSFLKGDEGTEIEIVEPAFLHGQDPHVYALYRALVRRWSRSFRVPEPLIQATGYMMGDRWTQAAEDWLRALRADFDVRPTETVCGEGVSVCEIRERRAVLYLAEPAFMALGNIVSGFSQQWKETLEVLPSSAETSHANISFPDPSRVRILSMVRRALGFSEQVLRPSWNSKKPSVGINSYGHPYTTIAGTPPFDPGVVQVMRRSVEERAEKLRRSLDVTR